MYSNLANFDSIQGKTIIDIVGLVAGSEEVEFYFDDGSKAVMNHIQDCCETVDIESVVGDVEDLIGSPILVAEEIVGETPEEWTAGKYDESYTWTFYKLATRKGYVDIRWYGASNGYYSESVSFYLYEKDSLQD